MTYDADHDGTLDANERDDAWGDLKQQQGAFA